MTLREYGLQFAAAWRFFVPFFPGGKRPEETEEIRMNTLPALMRPMTPLVGALLGLCAALPVFLISFAGRIPAALAGGILAPLIPEFLTEWKGLKALAGYVNSRRTGAPQQEALAGGNARAFHWTLAVLYILRALMSAALSAFSSAFWIAVSLTGSYLVRAELSTGRSKSGREFFPAEAPLRNAHWLTASGAILAVSLSVSWNPLPPLFAFAFSWLIGSYGVHLCAECTDGPSENALHIFGSAAEFALLLLGVLLYTHG